jgi:two-component system NtrC family response regulator/two-component system response regulator AtoC
VVRAKQDSSITATILVVDDEAAFRHVLGRFLRRDEHEVLEASDGTEALELVSGLVVHVALIDIVMPRMDGLTLMRRMLEEHPETRLVMMSASHDELDLPERTLGIVQTLRKPFTLEQVEAAVHEALKPKEYRPKGSVD